MTTTLVTGATGQVGRRFVPRLLQWTEPGDTVRVLVRDAERGARLAALGAEVVLGDLREESDRAKALAGADRVINVAAAFRDVPDEEAWAVNRDAALALGEQALDAGVGRFVQTSTNLVYQGGRNRPSREGDALLTEGTWVYAVSKAQADTGLLALHAERGLPLVLVRLAYVYGEGDPHLREALPRVAGWAAHRRLPMVHHADVAQALHRALLAPGVEGRAFDAADDAPVSAFDVYRLNGLPWDETAAREDATDPWFGVTDNQSLRDELGWRPQYPTIWTARAAGAL
ncbi:NAD(P)-dependent oxidoreductase [Streptacidiphilus sp. P02-A3a]|uniref:NAD-dependent epimerase/dehydratase family protein n=1 Tax=Streptacidiphilus sp. P02-A3a TaxID=2704468 RepID=UPI0015F8C29C|nr:NAD(P)-dependent oxidoreductase [Streptacidiphilus sp. P02-A3a]QMU68775.1 NAD(P)-dependent oxidoreductase [Streptacidiphilus sp. P02-A3a]